jgi:hypothetical protein
MKYTMLTLPALLFVMTQNAAEKWGTGGWSADYFKNVMGITLTIYPVQLYKNGALEGYQQRTLDGSSVMQVWKEGQEYKGVLAHSGGRKIPLSSPEMSYEDLQETYNNQHSNVGEKLLTEETKKSDVKK